MFNDDVTRWPWRRFRCGDRWRSWASRSQQPTSWTDPGLSTPQEIDRSFPLNLPMHSRWTISRHNPQTTCEQKHTDYKQCRILVDEYTMVWQNITIIALTWPSTWLVAWFACTSWKQLGSEDCRLPGRTTCSVHPPSACLATSVGPWSRAQSSLCVLL